MANLRRLQTQVGPPSRDGYPAAYAFATVQPESALLKDWSLHSVRADSERRAQALKCQRAKLWQPGEHRATAAAEARLQLEQERQLRQVRAETGEQAESARQHEWKRGARADAELRLAAASPTLRELKSQHMAAQAAQQQRLEQMRREVQTAEALQVSYVEQLESRADLDSYTRRKLGEDTKHRIATDQLRKDLLAQASSRRQESQKSFEEEQFRDRAMVTSTAERVREEDLQSLGLKRQLQAEIRDALRKLLAETARRLEADVLREEMDCLQAAAEQKRQAAFADRLARDRLEAEAKRRKVLKEIFDDLEAHQAEEQRLQHLHELLQREEFLAKQRRQDEEDLSRRLQARASAAQAAQEALKQLEERRRAEETEQANWRLEFLEQKAAAERVEQLGQQKRRMRMLAFQREADMLLEHRRGAAEAERQHVRAELLKTQLEEEEQSQIIEAERQLLLHEHGLVDSLFCDLLRATPLPRVRTSEQK